MRILAVIPAREGSKGVPKKNIKSLGGKPLLLYTAKSALESKLLTKIILSTDSEEISEVGKQVGIEVPFIRPDELALDTTPSIEVLKHAIMFYEEQQEFFDAICILQPTTPFREKGFIDQAVQKFISSQADTLISVLPVPHQFNPHWVFEIDNQEHLKIATGEKHIISRRQELPKSYYRDGAIYLIKTEIIRNANSLFGNTISYIESKPDFFVNIDTLEDWQLAESIIVKRNI
jgi:CMP-N,N'-diacetyllegionaminic acid synthase